MPATEDAEVVVGQSAMAQALVEVLGVLRSQIAEYDRRIAELVAVHPDRSWFASLPAAGPVQVSRLIAAFGSRRERFSQAYELQCLSAIAP